MGRGQAQARCLHKWMQDFIAECTKLPSNHHGEWCQSLIDDEDFTQDLHLHLQAIRKYIRSQDIFDYIAHPEILAKMKWTKTISLKMAQHWLKKMGYQWMITPTGMYHDGHE